MEVAVQTTTRIQAAHAVRVMAALGFWLAAVLFVVNVSLVTGWLGSADAADDAVAAVDQPTPAPVETPTLDSGPELVDLGSATVEFPAPATRTSQVLEVAGTEATLDLHSTTLDDGTTYNLGVIDYPERVDLTDPAVNLLASVSGAAGSAGGRIAEQDVTVFSQAPAVTFRIDTPGVSLAGRNVLVGRRLYTQSVAYRGVNDPEGASEFFDSFELD
jgi:hypothetical protein